MFSSKERGKTLIEVTLVIAIICLISAVVFYTWNTMSLKSQTNVLSQRIISIKNARQINMSGLQHKPMKRTEIGPYNTLFGIENGIGVVNKDWFWITATLGNKHLCELLLESDLGALKKDDNCDNNEAVFYFEKFPGFAQGNPDRNLQPRECPPNTICDENFNPIGCVLGYFLHNGACIQCPTNSINCQSAGFECEEGYYKDGIRCRSCGANVLSCDEDGNPTECADGYYLSGNSCVQCPTTGVDTCDDDGFTCLAGYYKNGNSCTSCGTGVAICDEDGNPTECKVNYYLSGNLCVACPTTGVATCDDDGFTCQAGYYKNGNSCTSCGTGIAICDEDGNPTECEDGYYLSGNSCVQCPTTGVDSCDTNGFSCLAGYYKNGNSCTSCGAGVAICDEDGNPTECKVNYYLSGNLCIACPTTGVATCDDDGFTCMTGYYKNGNTCTPCGAGVTECNESGLPVKCEKGYKLDGNKCVEDNGCDDNQCCLKMLDAGYILDKENSGTNRTFLMKDNETIKYNGRLNVEKDLDISECKLSFSDQSVLQVSVSEGKTLKVNSILIRSDGNNDHAYSVQNYGTIYSDSLTTNASIINRGTLNISDIDASSQMIDVGITNYGTINADNITVVGEEESFETRNLSQDLYAIRNTGTITATNKINVKAAKGLDNSGKLSAKNITCSIFSGPITAAGGVFTPETCIHNSSSTYSTVKTLEATNIKIEKGNLKNDGYLQASKIEISNGGLYNVYGEATIGTLIAYGGEYGLASCGECNCMISMKTGNITNAYLQGSKKAYCQGFYTGTIQNLYYCGSAGSTDMSIVNKVNDCSWMN